MEFWIAVLTGGAAVALIQSIFGIVRFKMERKAKKEDSAGENIEKKLAVIERQNTVQCTALRHLLYDRIRWQGQAYIAQGEIDFDDRRILNSMHDVYHNGLQGNGDLDNLMTEVNTLKLKQKG